MQNHVAEFTQTVWDYYRRHSRSMPWRDSPTPYLVLVSEIMLQQTQVTRVVPKFNRFISKFPTIKSLADAPLSDVLAQWSGLGYNRRAKYLWQAATQIQLRHGGQVPSTLPELVALPGIGVNTAGAILAYAFGQSSVFIETNIRTVMIHHFFIGSKNAVSDSQLRQCVKNTLPDSNIREWYWALMDYGTYLKATQSGKLAKVKGYRKQPVFNGSLRQVRGKVIKVLIESPKNATLLQSIIDDPRLSDVLQSLLKEGFIVQKQGQWHLTDH
ncbi:MAG TPA: hypothetical protein VFO38_04175 [Candidatus Saccharimonadales bacterium]|nr:hypothetical protein [Candidatus Saccharimonadales bacterium]